MLGMRPLAILTILDPYRFIQVYELRLKQIMSKYRFEKLVLIVVSKKLRQCGYRMCKLVLLTRI